MNRNNKYDEVYVGWDWNVLFYMYMYVFLVKRVIDIF